MRSTSDPGTSHLRAARTRNHAEAVENGRVSWSGRFGDLVAVPRKRHRKTAAPELVECTRHDVVVVGICGHGLWPEDAGQ